MSLVKIRQLIWQMLTDPSKFSAEDPIVVFELGLIGFQFVNVIEAWFNKRYDAILPGMVIIVGMMIGLLGPTLFVKTYRMNSREKLQADLKLKQQEEAVILTKQKAFLEVVKQKMKLFQAQTDEIRERTNKLFIEEMQVHARELAKSMDERLGLITYGDADKIVKKVDKVFEEFKVIESALDEVKDMFKLGEKDDSPELFDDLETPSRSLSFQESGKDEESEPCADESASAKLPVIQTPEEKGTSDFPVEQNADSSEEEKGEPTPSDPLKNALTELGIEDEEEELDDVPTGLDPSRQ